MAERPAGWGFATLRVHTRMIVVIGWSGRATTPAIVDALGRAKGAEAAKDAIETTRLFLAKYLKPASQGRSPSRHRTRTSLRRGERQGSFLLIEFHEAPTVM
jgi:hypothetical protein